MYVRLLSWWKHSFLKRCSINNDDDHNLYLGDFAHHLCGQSYGFSSNNVWMWELDYKESWVLKNWCFWTVVLKKTLESPLDNKEIKTVNPKGNQAWIFIETMLKLKLQYFGQLMQRTNSLEKTLMLGKVEGKRRGWQRIRWLDVITYWKVMRLSKPWELVMDREAWHAAVHGVANLDMTEWLNRNI